MKTVSLCMITRGESSLEEAIASARPGVDETVVVYTGPDDAKREADIMAMADTFRVCRDYNDAHGLAHFGKARQLSYDLATGGAAIWIDSDDVLVGADKIHEAVETAPPGASLLKMLYLYLHDARGVCTTIQWRERIAIPPQAFTWNRRVHETLDPNGGPTNVGDAADGLKVVHQRKGPQDHARNIRLLRLCLAEDPNDTRARFYLGLALYDSGDYGGAEREFDRFADDTDAHPAERTEALLRLSWLALNRGAARLALTRAMQAHSLQPWDICCFAIARAHQGLANMAYGADEQAAWGQVLFWARAGLNTPPSSGPLWQSPVDRTGVIHCTLSKALARLGDLDGAVASAMQAAAVVPEEADIQADLLVYKAAIAGREQAAGRAHAAQAVREADEAYAAGTLSRSKVEMVRHQVGAGPRPKGPRELSIVFACGEAAEPWNPDLMRERGIGGSEQAACYMAEHLAARGHLVRVYTNCGPQPRIFGRVEYFPTAMLPGAKGCDVLVGWRDGSAMEMVTAEARLLWAHDTAIANTNEWRWHLADRVLCLSEWHRECLTRVHPDLPVEKLWLTRNGIDLGNFAHATDRDPAKAIFSSSPTRGLGVLLDLWPDIRKRAIDLGAKDPSLHVFYGMSSTEAMARHQGNTKLLRMIAGWRSRMADMGGLGVLERGRVPPLLLAQEMLSAGAWLYPSWNEYAGDEQWCETSCIGAAEAQAAGLRIVTLAAGALPETVGEAGVLIDDDPRSGPGREAFVEASAIALSRRDDEDPVLGDQDPGWPYRRELQKVASERFDWSPVAEAWEAEMFTILGRITT